MAEEHSRFASPHRRAGHCHQGSTPLAVARWGRAMTFAPAFLDEIRARLPVSEVARRRVALKRVGGRWRGLSPFNNERTPSFYVNDAKRFWHDFSSGKHGDVFAFVQLTEGVSFPQAVALCAGLAGMALPRPSRGSLEAPDAEREAAETARKVAWKTAQAEKDAEAARDRMRQHAKAAYLWGRRQPITEGCPVALYLRRRGYAGAFPPSLGYLPANGRYGPAMIAGFGSCREIPGFDLRPEIEPPDPPFGLDAVHITKLTESGFKAEVDIVKGFVGSPGNLPIVLSATNDLGGMGVCEGIEDGLSVLQACGYGVWCAGTAGRMAKLAPLIPRYIEHITIYQHDDDAGRRGAQALAAALREQGYADDQVSITR